MWHVGIDLHREFMVMAAVNDTGEAMAPSMDRFSSSPVFKFSFWGTMAVPGDTELGSAGEQPNKG